MLRAQFKDHTDTDDDVLEVCVVEGLSFPLVLLLLPLPELSSQLRGAVLPPTADAHALVQLDAHLGEGTLPDVVLFEFFLDAGSEGLRVHSEEVLHAGLRKGRVNLLIPPDSIQAVLSVVHEGAYLA